MICKYIIHSRKQFNILRKTLAHVEFHGINKKQATKKEKNKNVFQK